MFMILKVLFLLLDVTQVQSQHNHNKIINWRSKCLTSLYLYLPSSVGPIVAPVWCFVGLYSAEGFEIHFKEIHFRMCRRANTFDMAVVMQYVPIKIVLS